MTDEQDDLTKLKNAIAKLITKYKELDADFKKHITTPDAHNPAMLARRKKG